MSYFEINKNKTCYAPKKPEIAEVKYLGIKSSQLTEPELNKIRVEETSIKKNPYILIIDRPTDNDSFYKCTNQDCREITAIEALHPDESAAIKRVFSAESYIIAQDDKQENLLLQERDNLAIQFSKQNVLGEPLDSESLYIPGVLHTTDKMTSSFTSGTKTSFLVGTAPLASYENLPSNLIDHNMIKIEIIEQGSSPNILYFDLESTEGTGTLLHGYYNKSSIPSWTSFTEVDSYFLKYLRQMKGALEEVYHGDTKIDGKIQAYEALKYIKDVIKFNEDKLNL